MTNLLPSEVVAQQFRTLKSDLPPYKPMVSFGLSLYAIPVVFGVAVGLWGKTTIDIASLLAVVAVFTGLIFNLAFMVFEKSLKMRKDPFGLVTETEFRFIDALQANVNYTVLVGILVSAWLASMCMFEAPNSLPVLGAFSNGVAGAGLCHLLLLCGMLLKRLGTLHAVLKP